MTWRERDDGRLVRRSRSVHLRAAMPKKNRSIDRRVLPKEEAEKPADEVEEEVVPSKHAKVDMVAFCVACGCNDAAQFSRRMLERKGRFGDRTRRCKACVGASEETQGGGSKKLPSEIADRWEAAQAAREKSAREWESVALASGTGTRDLAAANAAAERRVVQASLQAAAKAAALAASEEQQVEEEEEAEPTYNNEEEQSHASRPAEEAAPESLDAAETERRRRKLNKQLNQIKELKARRDEGGCLEATQVGHPRAGAPFNHELLNHELLNHEP